MDVFTARLEHIPRLLALNCSGIWNTYLVKVRQSLAQSPSLSWLILRVPSRFHPGNLS